MALPTMAICSTVACRPAGLSWFMGVDGTPAAAQAVSHSVISLGSAISDVYMTSGKSNVWLNPKRSAPSHQLVGAHLHA